ncbi:serine/threonine protein kinase [Tabrizicola piscis]|nr:serine/threonine-protein kinase [Tabrizicola piscis]
MMASAALKMDDVGIETFADELKVGTKLLYGQFEIESFLNAGGFGITYIARDSLQRRVVVKECFPSAFCRRTDTVVAARSRQRQDEFRSIVALFLQEALNLSKLDHPNIVKVHQVFQDNETAYMAMDLVEGPDLLETVEGTAPRLTPDQIILCLNKMLDALGYVHAQGFLHRDISPDNILLCRATGEPVLIDFGAARKDVTRKSRALSGLRVVKDGYSPQEFYISGSKQAPCSDLYALAASFCHLISGEAPRTSQERLSAIANREADPQRPLVGRVKGYPQAFLAAIDKAMSIFPKDRLQSVAEWQAMARGAAPVASVDGAAVAKPAAASATSPAPRLIQGRVQSQPAAAVVMRPRGALLRAALVPALAGALLLAGVMSVPADLWQRLGVTHSATAMAVAGATAPAPEPFAQQRVVRLPYHPDPADPARVDARLPWSPDWVQPGQRIVEVNGKPVQDGASIPGLMAEGLDLATLTDAKVIFGYEDGPGGDIVRKMADLAVVDQLKLGNGLIFEMEETPTGTRTVVAGLPATAKSALRLGDVLLAYAATGETLGTSTALQEILLREAANNVATYGFAVQRIDGIAVGSFTLPGTD